MKLEKIKIENFRSIEDKNIDFSENPRVLVGINESGKTNILHALRLLSSDFSPKKGDVREPTKGSIKNSKVLFIFKFEKEEIEEIYQNIQKRILTDDLPKKIIKVNDKNYNLKEIFEFNNEGLYEVNVMNGKKTPEYQVFNNTLELICNFKKPKSETNFTVQNKKGKTLNISNFKLIDFDLYKEIPQEHLEDASEKDLIDTIS